MTPFQDALNSGAFTIQQVIDALSNDGYIMEGHGPVGSACNRILIDSIEADFESYCRNKSIAVDDSLHLLATATDQGEDEGCYRYIVFNSNRYTLRQATQLLMAINTAERTVRNLTEKTL